MAKRSKGYRNGVRIVRFPGGRIARFHKPGTKAYAKGAAKKKRMGKLLAKRFGIKRRRGRGKTRRNPTVNHKRDLSDAIKAHNRGADNSANDNYNLANRLGSNHARTICRLAAASHTGDSRSKVSLSIISAWADGLLPVGAGYRTQDRHDWMLPYIATLPRRNPRRGHRGSRKKSRSPARRLLNRQRDFHFQEATANRWSDLSEKDLAAANRGLLRAYKKRRNPRQSGYASVEKQIKKVVRAIGKLPKHASSIRRLLYRRYDALLKKAEKFPEHWDIGPYN